MTSPARGSEPGLWNPVFALLRRLDDDIAALYAERGLAEVRPRFAAAVLELAAHGPRTIRALADGTGVTHSAMSQTVAAMRSAGLVGSAPGTDGRTRMVRLTTRGEEVSTFVRAEWDATEAAVAQRVHLGAGHLAPPRRLDHASSLSCPCAQRERPPVPIGHHGDVGFSYRAGSIGAAVKRLDDVETWAAESKSYAAEHLGLSFGDAGLLNQLGGTAGKVDTNTTRYMADLRNLVGEVRGALQVTADTYRSVDDHRAERLDRLARELEPGELAQTRALTEESQYVMYESTGWFDPSSRLVDPEVDPDIGGPSWWDLLSPTAVVNDAIYAVTKFAATIGLIDHAVNVVEEICKPISGDWNAFARAGNALENLGGFVFETRYCFRTIAGDLGDGWRGNASANARAYLYDVASDLTVSAEALTTAGQNYGQAADAAKSFAEVLSSVFEAITDTAVAAAIAVAATAGASATGIGLPVALITGGYALSRVKKVVDAVKDMLSALDDFGAVIDGVESTLGGLGVVSGYLPLEPLGSTHPPAVTT